MSILSNLDSNWMEQDEGEYEQSQIPSASLVVEWSCRNFPLSVTNIRIPSEKFTVGRSSENNFQLPFPVISRKHFTLEKSVESDDWLFTLHTSKNEVLVNDIRMEKEEPTIIRHNDKINLQGFAIFVFKCRRDDDVHSIISFQFKPLPSLNSTSMDSTHESPLSASTLSQSRSESHNFDYLDRNRSISPLSPTYKFDTNYSFSLDAGASYSVPLALTDHEISTALSELKTVARDCCEWFNDNIDKYRFTPTADEMLIRHYDSLLKYFKLFDHLKIVDDVALAESDCGDSGCIYALVVSARNLNKKRKQLDSIVEEMKRNNDFERMVYHFESFLWATIGESSKELKQFVEKNMDSGRAEDDTTWNKLKTIYGSLDAKVKRIDMLLEERENLKRDLESITEENESLTCKAMEMKKKVANAEVLALEYECLKESTKYREDDRRSKDALEKTIADLRTDVNTIKSEKEKLSSSVTELERKYSDLEGKNAELEEKCECLIWQMKEKNMARTSITCSSDIDSNTLDDVKSNWLELMESHFNCSICGEMFVEPTVTNCNHVFCAYCIKEWKKKKKICPFCRSPLKTECKATFIDDYITSLLKSMSESAYNDRLKTMEERNASKTPIPAKRARVSTNRRNQNVIVIPVAGNANPL